MQNFIFSNNFQDVLWQLLAFVYIYGTLISLGVPIYGKFMFSDNFWISQKLNMCSSLLKIQLVRKYGKSVKLNFILLCEGDPLSKRGQIAYALFPNHINIFLLSMCWVLEYDF